MALPPGDNELVKIVDANLAEAARRAGPWLACRVGCTQCCHGAFAINSLDVLRLREALLAAEPSIAEAIQKRARAWIAEYGPEFPGDRNTGILGTNDEDRAHFEEFANEAACPVLDPVTGRCDLYAGRPLTCRVFGPPVRTAGDEGREGLGHCELCFVSASPEQVAACEMPVPHELEAGLLDEIGGADETVVAFALLK